VRTSIPLRVIQAATLPDPAAQQLNRIPTSSDTLSAENGAVSELIVPSNHSAPRKPQAIAEVDRILRLNQ
jgi:hypothetical protein